MKKELYHKEINLLIRKFHVLLKNTGCAESAKEAILGSCGVESTKDLTLEQLKEAVLGLCKSQAAVANDKDLSKCEGGTADLWRKRVIAAIFGYYKVENRSATIEMVKGTACKASGYENFNKIPLERLKNLYFGFLKKKKDFESVQAITI
ncbi:MAG: hypothetical protein LBS50_05280 [Prevotellaceae bacterium]|jgi:hypothetical protein|nr:hypothetical protein [Prevotellaceae bacterium]